MDLYNKDGEKIGTDKLRINVVKSDEWYAAFLPNGTHITNKSTVPTTVAVGSTVQLYAITTPLRLHYKTMYSVKSSSVFTQGKVVATVNDSGLVTFKNKGKVTIMASPDTEDIINGILKLVNKFYEVNGTIDSDKIAGILIDYIGIDINRAVDRSLNGLYNYYGNNWCYLVDGLVDSSYNGLFNYYGTWYYLENGFLNWNYYGLTNYYGTYYGVEGGILDWNYSGALRYGASLYYVRNGVFDSSFNGEAEYCTGKIYNFKDGVSVDYDGYVADAAQLVKLIVYCELNDDTEVEIISAQGLPDLGPYGGVAVTVKIRSNDGSEEYYTAITCKNFQQYTNLIGIMENEGDGYLYVIIVAGNHNEDNSVVLSNDAILAYLDGMYSFTLLNPISV